MFYMIGLLFASTPVIEFKIHWKQSMTQNLSCLSVPLSQNDEYMPEYPLHNKHNEYYNFDK